MNVAAVLAAYGAVLGFQVANLGLQAWVVRRADSSAGASSPESDGRETGGGER